MGSERRMCEKRGEVVARAGVNKPGNKCHGGRFVSSHIEIIGGADITGRALAERSVFYFVPVEIIYK